MRSTIKYLAAAAVIASVPAMAASKCDRQCQLRADAAGQAAVAKSLNERAAALDKAYKAAKGIDRTLEIATSRVPGGRAAYEAGKLVGDKAYKLVKKAKK